MRELVRSQAQVELGRETLNRQMEDIEAANKKLTDEKRKMDGILKENNAALLAMEKSLCGKTSVVM